MKSTIKIKKDLKENPSPLKLYLNESLDSAIRQLFEPAEYRGIIL